MNVPGRVAVRVLAFAAVVVAIAGVVDGRAMFAAASQPAAAVVAHPTAIPSEHAPHHLAIRNAAVAPKTAPLQAAAIATPAPRPLRATLTPVHAPRPSPGQPQPVQYFNQLIGDDGLDTAVGVYSDCSGQTPLSRTEAAIDACITDRLYFVGHNAGVFTPLMSMGVGSLITYWDGAGVAHHLRVFAVVVWDRSAGTPPPTPGATAEFQACLVPDGSVLRNLEAEPV